MAELHSKGVATVILSSTDFGPEDKLICLASQSGETRTAVKIEFPKLPVNFVGSGDLFTAMMTAHLNDSSGDLQTALEKTIAIMQAVLSRTLDHANKVSAHGKPTPAQLELKIIQSKADIENPKVVIKAEKILPK